MRGDPRDRERSSLSIPRMETPAPQTTFSETSSRSGSTLLNLYHLIGLLVALFVLTGRWSPARLMTGADRALYLEVRFWLLLLFVIVIALPAINRRRPLLFSPSTYGLLVLLLLAFLGYMMMTSSWAIDNNLALVKVYELAITAVAIIAVSRSAFLVSSAGMRDAVWRSMVGVTALLAGLGLLSALSDTGRFRLSVLAGGPNTFGRMMGLLFLGCLFFWREHRSRWYWISGAMIAAFLVILSGSRGALIAMAASLVTFLLVERVKWTRLAALAIVSTAVAVVLLWYTPLGRIVAASFQHRVIDLSIEQRYLSGRGDRFLDAIELGSQNWITGSGLSSFPASGLGPYPHNIFLEALTDGGLIGVALLVAALTLGFTVLWRNRRQLDSISVAALVLALVFSQISGDFYDNRVVFIFLLLALIPRTHRTATAQDTAAPSPAAL